MVLDAAFAALRLGGGEVIWPVSAPEAPGGGPDVDMVARSGNIALLVSRLVSLTTGGSMSGAVQVRAPYADLTDRQVADLVLDMDLPIWTCWWMTDRGGPLGEAAAREREKWTALLKAAGWIGTLEAKAAIHVRPLAPRRSDSAAQTGETR